MRNPVLVFREVYKTYADETILKGVNLTLEEGDFTAIIGPSGSGKSTLLHLAGGLELPSGGEIYLFGRRIDNLPEDQRDRLRRGRVAYIFQFHYLLEDFTVEENLEIFGRLLGVPDVEKKVEQILKTLGLYHRRRYKPYHLSGGERQRVSIGRALISGAKLILADEPTGNLDPLQSEEIFQLFKSLNSRGITFLVVTHNRNLLKFFNRVYLLKGGVLSDYSPL
jgi:lipoprotein-releasing system ATP-binding protein